MIVTLRSGGASQRSCSGCGSRCPRLSRAGCRPGGALTSPPCSAPVPPPPKPPFTLPLSVEPTCCSRKAHARQHAQIPPCRPLLRASTLPSPPPSAVCVPQLRPRELKLQVQGLGAGRGGGGLGRAGGIGMKPAMTFPFPAWLSQVTKTFKSHRVLFPIPVPHPTKTPGSKIKCPV